MVTTENAQALTRSVASWCKGRELETASRRDVEGRKCRALHRLELITLHYGCGLRRACPPTHRCAVRSAAKRIVTSERLQRKASASLTSSRKTLLPLQQNHIARLLQSLTQTARWFRMARFGSSVVDAAGLRDSAAMASRDPKPKHEFRTCQHP